MAVSAPGLLFVGWLVLLVVTFMIDEKLSQWVFVGGLILGLMLLIWSVGTFNALVALGFLGVEAILLVLYLAYERNIWLYLAGGNACVAAMVWWFGVAEFLLLLAITAGVTAALPIVFLIFRAIVQATLNRTVLEIFDTQRKTKHKIGTDGELIPIYFNNPHKIFIFRGTGNEVMDRPIFLTSGTYVLRHKTRGSSEFTVSLIRVDTNLKENTLKPKGKGSSTFIIEEEGQFVFQVEHPGERWRIEVCSL